jgi:ketosteroid isomerase-like protein
MRRCGKTCLLLAISFSALAAHAQETPPTDAPSTRTDLIASSVDREADHAALRELLVKAADALNTRNFDLIASSLHPTFTVISVDNQKLVGLDAFRKYWSGLFEGPSALLKGFDAKPVADELTQFLGDTVGVVYGVSDDTYTFNDGDVRTMRTRWSAVVQKDTDGWKVVNAHFSANVLDNPVVDATRSYLAKAAIAAAVGGLLLGLIIMALLRGRRSS